MEQRLETVGNGTMKTKYVLSIIGGKRVRVTSLCREVDCSSGGTVVVSVTVVRLQSKSLGLYHRSNFTKSGKASRDLSEWHQSNNAFPYVMIYDL